MSIDTLAGAVRIPAAARVRPVIARVFTAAIGG